MTSEMKKNELIPILIDGVPHEVDPGFTIYQACQQAGIEIPTFCYHPKLTIAGNCRMCLVEIKGAPKLAASCAMPLRPNMEILTGSDKVKTARKAVLEFLLINHPLDCPICDQGGECDLQDLTMSYGPGTSRYEEHKRAVPQKNFGPLIKTKMNRCIHCMRCVRFGREIAGISDLGGLYRGEHAEISAALGQMVTSELSGNMIDICPVGALTAKPYAFHGRAWEFAHTQGIDVHDAAGSNIRIDTRGQEVMRILPIANDLINEDWISDKTRFSFDGLKRQRLDKPYVKENGRLVPATWAEAFKRISDAFGSLKPQEIGVIAGDLCEVESLFAMKELMGNLRVDNTDCRQKNEFLPLKQRRDYLFNTTIAGIEQADYCLLIGTNPRYEAAMVNARLRKAYVHNNLQIDLIAPQIDLTYPYDHLGEAFSTLEKVTSKDKARPMMILGTGALQHSQGEAIYALARRLADKHGFIRSDWNGFNVLPLSASRVGALDIGFHSPEPVVQQLKHKKLKAVYLLGADEIPLDLLKDTFVIYQGSHGDHSVYAADVVLPGTAFPEKEGTFVNMEGRVQRSLQAMLPLGDAKEDWKIIHELAAFLNKPLSFETQAQLRSKLESQHPHFAALAALPQDTWSATSYGNASSLLNGHVTLPVHNFYQTNVITRASETMARCTETYYASHIQREGTHG